ncbi:hypothetical protein EON83_10920 [bacterium]|nr:MAG: hypothetical protein EON83_10920 [bacterium]
MNLEILKQHDIPEQSDEQFAATCNESTGVTYGNVEMVTTMNYLYLHNIWDRLERIRIDPAKTERYGLDFVIRIAKFMTTVQFYPKTNYAHFVPDASALVMLGEITQPEAAGFLALGSRNITRYEDWGGESGALITATDVRIMRNQDAANNVQQLLEYAGSAFGEVLALLQGAQNAMREGQVVEEPTRAEVIARFVQTMEAL